MNTTIRKKIYTAISCALGSAALCTALVNCVEADDVTSKTIQYSDLDINRVEGAKVLYKRIRTAALEVCSSSIGTDPIMRLAMKACIDKTIDNAVKGVDAPALTSLRFGGTDLRLASR